MKPVPQQLLNANNAEVLSYLAPLSCHGDNIESLQALLASSPDVTAFCPDSRNYRYFLWYIRETVFAFGVGMRGVSLRIPCDRLTAKEEHEVQRFDGECWHSVRYDYDHLDDMVTLALEHVRSKSQT